jgi:hypothetical protein
MRIIAAENVLSTQKYRCRLQVSVMTEEKKYTEEEHKNFAVDLFNLTWSLLDKKDRTREEDDKMIHAAHASRFHWGEIGTPLHFERGEWQISRAYSVLNRPEPALYHAKRCLGICKENSIGDFDIAFAYEAMARASAIAGKKPDCEKYLRLAKEAGDQIKKKGDKDYFFSELDTISC